MENHKQKPGCLSILFPWLFNSQEKVDSGPLPYRLRDDFLSTTEFSFYKVLASILGTRFTIQSKVRLADVFFVARPNENASYLNKIMSKHLDFLICDSTTMKPLLGIELDDSSHSQPNRQQRDIFLEKACQAASLPLLRLPAQREYNSRDLAAQIAPSLRVKIEQSVTPSAQTQTPAVQMPICPKCGITMVLRTVTQGEHKGKQFYGCANFPRCREFKPVKTN